MIVALAWGIGLACHWFFAIVAPGLRERMITRRGRAARAARRHTRAAPARRRARAAPRGALGLDRPRDPQSDHRRQEPGAADGRGSGARATTSSTRKVALDELDRVERSISHLLRFAREEEMQLREVRLDDVVESALEALADRVERQHVTRARELDAGQRCSADPEKLRRVLLNLLGNALDAFEEAHTRSRASRSQAGHNLAGSELWLRVRDNGPGMDDARLGKIFNPFYTSKADGTGLGLAISKKLVAAHGGTHRGPLAPGDGTEFLLTLPREHAESVGGRREGGAARRRLGLRGRRRFARRVLAALLVVAVLSAAVAPGRRGGGLPLGPRAGEASWRAAWWSPSSSGASSSARPPGGLRRAVPRERQEPRRGADPRARRALRLGGGRHPRPAARGAGLRAPDGRRAGFAARTPTTRASPSASSTAWSAASPSCCASRAAARRERAGAREPARGTAVSDAPADRRGRARHPPGALGPAAPRGLRGRAGRGRRRGAAPPRRRALRPGARPTSPSARAERHGRAARRARPTSPRRRW